MTLKTIETGIKTFGKLLVKHAPTIMTVTGVLLMGGSIVKTVIEAPKAKAEIEKLDADEGLSHKAYLREKTRILWYRYWATLLMGASGAAMILWSHRISLQRTAMAIAAYQMSSDDLKKLEKKILEKDGDKHLESLRDEIAKDGVGNGPDPNTPIIDTGNGKTLCQDVVSGRYFFSDIEKLRRAENDINADINQQARNGCETDISLNEWYDYIGLDHIKTGSKLGWHNQQVKLRFTSGLTADGTPYLVMGYSNAPKWEFDIDDRAIDSSDWCDR